MEQPTKDVYSLFANLPYYTLFPLISLGISVDQRKMKEIFWEVRAKKWSYGRDVQMSNLATISPFVSKHGREIREIRFYKKSRPNL